MKNRKRKNLWPISNRKCLKKKKKKKKKKKREREREYWMGDRDRRAKK